VAQVAAAGHPADVSVFTMLVADDGKALSKLKDSLVAPINDSDIV
jgi:hypothetical protein